MKAGRELDAIIAEKVMHECMPIESPYQDTHYRWFKGANGAIFPDHQLPAYSTDIAAAWEVVEKLKADGRTIDVMSASPGWRCRIDCMHDDYPEVRAETATLAICLAALKSVGVELEVTT